MASARFSPDDLGILGQADFAKLCSSETLIANPSIRDRTGWDFRVEFPNADLSSAIPLDQRPSPLPALVQIKSVYETTSTVTLKLRTFERLMKSSEPAFVVIPIYSEHNELVGICAIHLVGAALEKSLKRLATLHTAKGTISENDTISFSKQKWWSGTNYPMAGCLRSFLTTSIGDFGGQESYIVNKARELKTLGYDENSHIFGNMTLIAESEDELIEGMLGLRDLKASYFAVSDRRFGIERLLHKMEIGEGTVSFSPTEKMPCLLRVYGANGNRLGDFQADLVSPGILPSEDSKLRFLIYVGDLRLDISFAGRLAAHMSDLYDASYTIGRWAEIFDLIYSLLSPGGKIELLTPSYQRAWSAENISFENNALEILAWCSAIKRSLRHVRLILDRANILQKEVNFQVISDSDRVFEKASILLAGADVPFSLGIKAEKSKPLELLFDKVYGLTFAGWIDVGTAVIAYVVGAKAQLKETDGEYSLECTTTTESEVSVVGDASAYDSMIEDHYRRHNSLLQVAADKPIFDEQPVGR